MAYISQYIPCYGQKKNGDMVKYTDDLDFVRVVRYDDSMKGTRVDTHGTVYVLVLCSTNVKENHNVYSPWLDRFFKLVKKEYEELWRSDDGHLVTAYDLIRPIRRLDPEHYVEGLTFNESELTLLKYAK